MDDAARLRAIRKCIIECGDDPTDEAVAAQFHYETGREVPGVWRPRHVGTVQPPAAPAEGPHTPVGCED